MVPPFLLGACTSVHSGLLVNGSSGIRQSESLSLELTESLLCLQRGSQGVSSKEVAMSIPEGGHAGPLALR